MKEKLPLGQGQNLCEVYSVDKHIYRSDEEDIPPSLKGCGNIVSSCHEYRVFVDDISITLIDIRHEIAERMDTIIQRSFVGAPYPISSGLPCRAYSVHIASDEAVGCWG